MLSALALGGCATQVAVTPDSGLRSFKPIRWSCADTPETRKQVVAHNSVYASLKAGKKVIYADDCKAEEAIS